MVGTATHIQAFHDGIKGGFEKEGHRVPFTSRCIDPTVLGTAVHTIRPPLQDITQIDHETAWNRGNGNPLLGASLVQNLQTVLFVRQEDGNHAVIGVGPARVNAGMHVTGRCRLVEQAQ